MCAILCISGHMKSFLKEDGIIWIKAILWSSDSSKVPTDRQGLKTRSVSGVAFREGGIGALIHLKDLGGWWPKAGCHCCLGRWYWGAGVEHHCKGQLWLSWVSMTSSSGMQDCLVVKAGTLESTIGVWILDPLLPSYKRWGRHLTSLSFSSLKCKFNGVVLPLCHHTEHWVEW